MDDTENLQFSVYMQPIVSLYHITISSSNLKCVELQDSRPPHLQGTPRECLKLQMTLNTTGVMFKVYSRGLQKVHGLKTQLKDKSGLSGAGAVV